MLQVKDSFLDLERHRVQLEKSIKELERALLYWRKQDAEYETLKDEVESVQAASGSVQENLARVRREFDCEVIGKDEIDKIFGKQEARSPEQIVNLLSHRIDYVTRNIDTLSKKLETTQNQYAAATVISQPDATDENGMPITEILEELDDDDNVVSYRLQRPGDAQPQIREVLEKAGVKDLPELNKKPGSDPTPSAENATQLLGQTQSDSDAPSRASESQEIESKPKKAVKFTDDTKDANEQAMSRKAQRVAQIMKDAREHEELQKKEPVIPDDESEDEAAMRRQMLEYAMNEVGPVVAELSLEEGGSDDEFDDDEMMDEDYDEDYEDYDDDLDDEDEQGRSKTSVITPEYKRRMMELEKRLGVPSRFTQDVTEAPEEPEDDSSNEEAPNGREGIGMIKVQNGALDGAPQVAPSSTKVSTKPSSMKASATNEAKKEVRFANALDIAPDTGTPKAASSQPVRQEVDPLSDVVERTAPSKPSGRKEPKRHSRFKMQRDTTGSSMDRDDFSSFANTDGTIPKGPLDLPTRFLNQERPEAPSGPEGKILAEAIVEHEPSTEATDPDDIDDAMLHQEVAEEYQRHRKTFINRQGGFLKDNEDPFQSEDQSSRPVSRFKAARLSQK